MANHPTDHHSDDHHDAPVHQEPWVTHLTLAICIGIVFAMLGLKFLT